MGVRSNSGRRTALRLQVPAQPIFPDLLQGHLAKLTEHAAHVEMVIDAVAKHDLRVTRVAQCLQRQPVGVLQPVDRAIDSR